MHFRIIPNRGSVPIEGKNIGYLLTDNWNDWFEFTTLYWLFYFDEVGMKHDIGGTKIGQFDMKNDQRRPNLPVKFDALGSEFFSLGQDVEFYENVIALGQSTSDALVNALNDVAAKPDIYLLARNEKVMGTSLMRSVNERTIVGQFRRILSGGVRLTPYNFSYRGPKQLAGESEPVEMTFSVKPDSKPPTNLQVIIGRNGVGKSFLLNAMARALVRSNEFPDDDGCFSDEADELAETLESPFSNVVSVTFSAFDEFPLIRHSKNTLKTVQYTNIGLRKRKRVSSGDGTRRIETITQEPSDLTEDFISSARICTQGEKRSRWRKALHTLESDPIFEESEVSDLLEIETEDFGRSAGSLYRRLSAGHKIVLLTVTKLVEKVEERSLVLMDEPEAHLHPLLLAAFIRGLSDLLINRNGVAIIATHSPVVLQEVPKNCVWKVRRYGGNTIAERLRTETFAEHVGHLTHEIFGLEVTRSGFHKMIAESVGQHDNFDDVANKFDFEIGSEGRALISMLLAQRDVSNIGSDE